MEQNRQIAPAALNNSLIGDLRQIIEQVTFMKV